MSPVLNVAIPCPKCWSSPVRTSSVPWLRRLFWCPKCEWRNIRVVFVRHERAV